jgi:CubicO group peptidase (beta-lactamase class C family)
MKTWRTFFVAAGLLFSTGGLDAEEGISNQLRVELALRDYAKLMCSAVFISGRNLEEAEQDSGPLVTENIRSSYSALSESERVANTKLLVDYKRKMVTATLRDFAPGVARFYGDQGCVILPRGADKAFFKPSRIQTHLPKGTSQPWPMGELLPEQSLPAGIGAAKLQAAVDRAFYDPQGKTVAFLVIYKGRVVAERYGLGVKQDTLLEGWSMGKSLLAALVGILIKDGEFGLYDPAPVPEWQRPGDPRSAIRIADLLRMSSGLHFTAPRDPDFSPDVFPDHVYVYNGAINIFEFAYARPLQFPPNTEGRYRNCDPLTLGYIVQQTAKRRGDDYF